MRSVDMITNDMGDSNAEIVWLICGKNDENIYFNSSTMYNML